MLPRIMETRTQLVMLLRKPINQVDANLNADIRVDAEVGNASLETSTFYLV